MAVILLARRGRGKLVSPIAGYNETLFEILVDLATRPKRIGRAMLVPVKATDIAVT